MHSKGENVDEDTKSSITLGRADEITQDKLTTKGTTLADKATDNGTALFSKASILSDNAKPDGITESQANAAIATFKRDFGNIDGVEFKVYKTLADAIGESEAKKIGRVKGFYLPNSKTIAIIRDALHHVQDAAETLRHETLGHFGLNLLKPADKLAFLGDIARSKNNLFLREMFAEVVRNYPELANDEFMQAEEVFAKVAEEQPSELTQWLDKQLLKLLGLFRKIGFLKGYVTKADMRDIAKSLAEGIRRGDSQKTFPKNNHSQFSKSTLPKLRVNLSNVTESGGHFETGVPVTFKYVHNTASYTALLGKKGKPPIDSPYGRGYEPSRQYLTVVGRHPAERRSEMEYGEVTFNNPLVIDNDSLNWKKQLSDSFGGKTGKYLSEAVIQAGYDGIVTTENGHTSEVVNLTNFDKSIAKYSKSTTPIATPHTQSTLHAAITKALDKLFGTGWTKSLEATGKFKLISAAEAVKLAGQSAADAKGFYDANTDTTYFVHDNISQDTSSKALVGLVLHEISTHALQMGKTNEAFKALLKRFEAMKATNPKVQAAFDRVPSDTKAEDKLEEALAYYIEHNVDSPLSKRIVEAFRQLVRAIGNNIKGMDKLKFMQWANKLTETELQNMAVSALRNAPSDLQFDNVGRNSDSIKLAKEKGYKGNDNGEASEWLSAVAKGLDMSKEARMLRAKNMGFITDIQSVIEVNSGQDRGGAVEAGSSTRGSGLSGIISGKDTQRENARRLGRSLGNDPQTFYHGTADNISKFELSHPNRKDFGWLGDGVYITNDPLMADAYANSKAGNDNANVMPLYIRPTNLYQATLEDKKRLKHVNKAGVLKFTEMVKQDGYDGAELTYSDGTSGNLYIQS